MCERELCYIEFDQPVTPAQANQLGVLLEYDKSDYGSMSHGSEHNWNSPENSVHIGDVPPGSFGQAALWLRGSEKEVYYNYAGAWRPMDEQNGTWHVRLWAKAKAGTPSLSVRMGGISGAGIYEHNYHITSPSVKDGGVPILLRNKIIASLGGSINLINDSLHVMRDLNVRNQCLFNLNQKRFCEDVKLWGFMPGLSLKEPRYRPSFLATEIANQVIAGDMVETTHAQDEPTFTAHGIMAWEWNKQPEFVDYGPLPTIRSYAFKNGKIRGLILVNFDTTDAHTARLALPAAVKNKTAKAWCLAADSIAANNEYETGDPQVKIAEETINNFSSGSEIKLPPHSMLVLKWQSGD